MNIEESLSYLNGLIIGRPPQPAPYTPTKMDRMRHLCGLLDNPEGGFPAALVAGTKGKGSTSAMLASMLQAAGYRVGLYTKPHLVDFRERIRIGGELISQEELASLVGEIRDAIVRGDGGPGWPPTYFEASAAIAFMHFARRAVDIAVVEVGIGGRLDATNVVNPIVSVITTVGYDHTDLLGNSLRRIAEEDTGIIRPSGRAVTVPQPAAASDVIEEAAASKGAALVRVGREIRYRTLRSTVRGIRVTVCGQLRTYRDVAVPLLGRHQSLNTATAIGAVEGLEAAGFTVPEPAVRSGLAGLRWPARIEVVRDCCPTLIVDVAHNAVSFQALRKVLDEVFPGRRIILVIGVLGNKDLAGIANIIAPRASVVVATRADDHRALPPADIAIAFCPGVADIRIVEDPVDALECALEVASPEDLVCVTGSFHVAGPVLAHLAAAPALQAR